MATFEEFLVQIRQRSTPINPIARIKTFARELAEGATLGCWSSIIPAHPTYTKNDEFEYRNQLSVHLLEIPTLFIDYTFEPVQLEKILRYYETRWNSTPLTFDLLLSTGYISISKARLEITTKAISLLDEVEPSTIFISYKRSESSAFALLVLARLKEYNLEPFVDMSLRAGEDWHPALENHIKSRDYLIVLVGKETLKSEVTVKEIQWAIQYQKSIIPIWHNGFEFDENEAQDIPSEVAIGRKHAIKVFEESALGYNTAIVELLNQFEITP